MEGKSEVSKFNENFNSSKRSTNISSIVSENQDYTETIYNVNDVELLCEENKTRHDEHIYAYPERLVTTISYIFCILAIICAWGVVDSIVDVISAKQAHIALACYSIIFGIAIIVLTLYILFIDRSYRPYNFF
ncbi:conserved protein, unknown function [Hepatocystis sp. ex Piliocolobus tephrosceles]|nr:conserved protein, unknown function [Hepatocystis sp. ex Piliocolobus tephrosceles]